MQVDQHRASNTWDIADVLHSDLFSSSSAVASSSTMAGPSPSTSFSNSSRESTPMSSHLPTPPQPAPYASFPATAGPSTSSVDPASENYFSFLDDGKGVSSQTDFFNPNGYDLSFAGSNFDYSMMMTSPMDAPQPEFGMDMGMMMGVGGGMDMGINPQLVDSPAPLHTMAEEPEPEEQAQDQVEDAVEESAPSPTTRSSSRRKEEVAAPTRSKRGRAAKASASTSPTTATTAPRTASQQEAPLTLTIAPVKVGGRGGARRGTVQSGGITKKSQASGGVGNVAVYATSVLKEEKENRGRALALPSPPSSTHGEEAEESPAPAPPTTASNTVLTGNALVAHGRKVTPFDLGIDGLNLSASFAIPPGTFNVTTPSAVGSSSGLGVGALMAAAGTGAPAKYNFSGKKAGEREQSVDADGDGDEIPADWRPSPEALAKMTSKEKRQLRNKISARNFRVRRKEYISTLELDIAERDRLLDAIRTELGSSRNENQALRQEIEALKRTLLTGRGVNDTSPTDNLPPPAPLPEKSAAERVMQQQQQQQQQQSSPLIKPNTQKDVSQHSTFWGGGGPTGAAGGLGGGIVPVHSAWVPSVASGFANIGGPYGVTSVGVGAVPPRKLQENMNPLLRTPIVSEEKKEEKKDFDEFSDMNMFTMKSMDAYRMHLWGKMAAQYHAHQQQQQHIVTPPTPPHQPISIQQESPKIQQIPIQHTPATPQNLFLLQQQAQQHASQYHANNNNNYHYNHLPSGLASNMRPLHFTGMSSAALAGKGHSSDARTPLGNVSNTHTPLLSALLSGKSGLLKGTVPDRKQIEKETQQREMMERQQEQARLAVLAAVASQTVFKKLGQAFWDAFSGSSSSSGGSNPVGGPVMPSYANGGQGWDAEKVRKVLEGKAVVKIVDVESEPVGKAAVVPKSEGIVSKWRCNKASAGNVSTGGSVSVPSSPLMKASVPSDAGVAGLCESLEEKMRSLALGPGVRRKAVNE